MRILTHLCDDKVLQRRSHALTQRYLLQLAATGEVGAHGGEIGARERNARLQIERLLVLNVHGEAMKELTEHVLEEYVDRVRLALTQRRMCGGERGVSLQGARRRASAAARRHSPPLTLLHSASASSSLHVGARASRVAASSLCAPPPAPPVLNGSRRSIQPLLSLSSDAAAAGSLLVTLTTLARSSKAAIAR